MPVRKIMSVKHYELYETKWFWGKNSLVKAEKYASENKLDFFVACDVFYECQQKAFTAYKDLKAFWTATKNILPEEKAFYEIIRKDRQCRLFADIEWPLDWKSKNDIIKLFQDTLNTAFEKIGTTCEWDDGIFTDACCVEKNKGSLHFIHPDIIFENLDSQRRFWNEVEIIMKKDDSLYFLDSTEKSLIVKTFVDFAVYNKNREMRCVLSSKMKKGVLERPLIPDFPVTDKNAFIFFITHTNRGWKYINWSKEQCLDVSTLPEDISLGRDRMIYSKEILQSLVDPFDVTIDQLKGSLITLRNKKKVRVCPLGGEENVSDNAYMTIKNGCLRYHCHDRACKGHSKVIHVFKEEDLFEEIPWEKYTRSINDAHKNNNETTYNTRLYEVLRDMNKYICVIIGSSKPYFMIRHTSLDQLKNRFVYYTRQIKTSLKDTYQNYRISTFAKKPTTISLVDKWLSWEGRRTYYSEVFVDQVTSEKEFNIFSGLSITMEKAHSLGNKDITPFLNFIKVAWCNNQQDLYEWILNWIAHTIQKPLVKMTTALVLRGEEGVGKGMVVQKLIQILGKHYCCQPTNANDLLGNFNSIVDRKMLLFIDELVWGGDKQRAGILKKLISEENGSINEKGIPQRTFVNNYNIIMASNEEWVVPAGNNARRFLVLEVQNTRLNRSDVYNCCPYSLAKFFYSRDISNFESQTIIATPGLRYQKELSACPVTKFALDIAHEEFKLESLQKEVIFSQFQSLYHDKYITYRMFLKKLKTIINVVEHRPHAGKRELQFPPIPEMRTQINEFFKQDMFSD